MIELKFTFATQDELAAFCAKLYGYAQGTGTLPVAQVVTPEVAATPVAPTRVKGGAVKATAAALVAADPTPAAAEAAPATSEPTAPAVEVAAPAPSSASAQQSATTPSASAPSVEKQYIFSDADGYSKDPTYANEVSPKIANTVKLGMSQRGAVVALLEKYGVKRGNFVPHAKWPQFVADLDAIAATAA